MSPRPGPRSARPFPSCRIHSAICRAASAASSPRLPTSPPARAHACSSLRAVLTPNRAQLARPAARRSFGARPAISVGQRRQEVPELVALGAEVLPIRLGGRNLDRDALGDVESVTLETDDLLRIVGQELQVLD